LLVLATALPACNRRQPSVAHTERVLNQALCATCCLTRPAFRFLYSLPFAFRAVSTQQPDVLGICLSGAPPSVLEPHPESRKWPIGPAKNHGLAAGNCSKLRVCGWLSSFRAYQCCHSGRSYPPNPRAARRRGPSVCSRRRLPGSQGLEPSWVKDERQKYRFRQRLAFDSQGSHLIWQLHT